MNKIMEKELKNFRNHINDKDEFYLLKEYSFNNESNIEYSIIIPVYNQENIIVKNINSIIKYTKNTFEIIIILDFCNDNSEKNIIMYFDNIENINNDLVNVRIFKQPNSPIFETSCDNIGFIFSKGKYCLEIQADMEMTQNGYNIELTKPFLCLPNVIAVSGRCAHNLFKHNIGIGKLGGLVEKSVNELGIDKNKFYIYETCNRGPLLLCKDKLKKLGYLDECNYHLENSDHDLMARAYINYNYICGYVPIDYISNLEDGSTRKNDPYKKINDEYKYKRIDKHEIKGYTGISGESINKYKNIWIERKPIVYNL
jgi:glycosyltransferase involved in cell wall biosynthesis